MREGGKNKHLERKKTFNFPQKSNEGENTNKKNLQWSNQLVKFH